jgi:hypothetical protein
MTLRAMNLGSQGRRLCTPDPTMKSHLPMDDEDWDRGVRYSGPYNQASIDPCSATDPVSERTPRSVVTSGTQGRPVCPTR